MNLNLVINIYYLGRAEGPSASKGHRKLDTELDFIILARPTHMLTDDLRTFGLTMLMQ